MNDYAELIERLRNTPSRSKRRLLDEAAAAIIVLQGNHEISYNEFDRYQQLAMKTAAPDRSDDAMLAEAVMGLSGECGEVADLLKKHMFQGHPLDEDEMLEELGDVLWYLQLATTALGYPLYVVASRNLDKLRRRYPQGFDPKRSVNRSEYDD